MMSGRFCGMMCIALAVLVCPALSESLPTLELLPQINLQSQEAAVDSARDSISADLPAQLDTTSDSMLIPMEAAVGDTVILTPSPYTATIDSSVIEAYLTENFTPAPKRSASKTMLKSVVFPGWGQVANKKYIKAGIIFAVESYFIYKAVDFGIKAGDSRDYWQSLPDSLAAQKAEAFRAYTDDRDNRNSNIWYTVIVTFLSMIDAYVDAHLQDFPDTEQAADKISLDIAPGDETRVSVVLRF